MRQTGGGFGIDRAKVQPAHTVIPQRQRRLPEHRLMHAAALCLRAGPAGLIGGGSAMADKGHGRPDFTVLPPVPDAPRGGRQAARKIGGQAAVAQAVALQGPKERWYAVTSFFRTALGVSRATECPVTLKLRYRRLCQSLVDLGVAMGVSCPKTLKFSF
jgi:hypothetical protein